MKRFGISFLILGALLLTACAGGSETSAESNDLQAPQVSSDTENTVPQVADGSNQQAGGAVEMNDRPVNDQTKLVVGIFELEATDQAVTPEQAASLIPLWNSLLELSQSQDGTQEQMDASVEQIKAVLTAEQLATIEAMVIDQQIVTVFMQEQDIEMDGMQRGLGDGQSFPQGTPSTDQMNKPGQGNPSDAGTPGTGGPGGNAASQGTPAEDQSQPADGQGQQPGRMGGLNFASSALIEALLEMLESK